MKTITTAQKKKFIRSLHELMQQEKLLEMEKFIQHGNTTTLTHCFVVAYYSYCLALLLPIRFRYKSMIRGAMLHDFYLYDWHDPDPVHRLHGFFHPRFALDNARKHFILNSVEEDIILTHMWPLTLRAVPRCREALLVCMVDKFCSLAETLYIPILSQDMLQIFEGLGQTTPGL